MNTKLVISNLSVAFEEKKNVLSNINLEINDTEIGCLLGPSGCGKTTLLRAIAGFETINSGSILKDGVCISNNLENMPIASRSMGMVFQDYALFPNMDVSSNIEFGLKDLSKEDKSDRVDYLLDLVDLNQCKNKYPHELSGGEQQRVALARALAPSPDILLMDEPFSNIDAEIKEDLVSDVRDLLKQLKMTSIIVTHDQYEAFNIADKIAIINDGEIQQVGNPYDIYHKPNNKFVADFIGFGVFMPIKKLNNEAFEIPLGILDDNKIKNDLSKYTNAEILIRPDDIIHNDSSDLKAVVLEKQFRGAEFLYRLLYNEKYPLLCYAPSHHNHSIGESIGIELDMEHYVIFEKDEKK